MMDVENSVDLYADLLEESAPAEVTQTNQAKTSPVLDDTSRLTSFELYDELITHEGLQHEALVKELNEKYKTAVDTIHDLEKELEASKKQETYYKEKCQTLEKNISVLFVTAKAELQRKDSQIEELRERPHRWKPSCHKPHPADALAKEESYVRSNGHSDGANHSANRSKPRKSEQTRSPRKRKFWGSGDEVRDSSKKRSRKEDSSYKRAEPNSSQGLQFHSEKSRDGLISAKKLVEKSIKDLRNRRSNEYKHSARDNSESVIETCLPGEGLDNGTSELDQTSFIVSKCSRPPQESGNGHITEGILPSKENDFSMKNLIDHQKEERKSPKEKSSQETAEFSNVKMSSREKNYQSSNAKLKLQSSSKLEKEKDSREKKYDRYSERKRSDKCERRSSGKSDVRRDRNSTRQTKKSKEYSESSSKNSEVPKDFRFKDKTESQDLRSRLHRKVSDEKSKEVNHNQESKRCRYEKNEPDPMLCEQKPLSPKPDTSQLRDKSEDWLCVEKLMSKINSHNDEHHSETVTDVQNVSSEQISNDCDGGELCSKAAESEKKTLTPKLLSKPVEKRSVAKMSNVEEAMVRVTEEKISKYNIASNNEIKALATETEGLTRREDFSEEEKNPKNDVCLKESKTKAEGDKNRNGSQSFSCGNDPSDVFIEELMLMDKMSEDQKDDECGVIQSNADSLNFCMKEKEKNASACHNTVVPEPQEGSLSCFDIKLHVSEKEIKDLLGNEESLSEGISSSKPNHQKVYSTEERKDRSRGGQTKSSGHVEKKSKKKTSVRRENRGVEKIKDSEPVPSRTVLRLPLGSKNVFSESVFEHAKPISVKEKVYMSAKGTKIVLKSQSLKTKETKPIPKNSMSKKEYDADREFLNQLKTKYSKEHTSKLSAFKRNSAAKFETEVKSSDAVKTPNLNSEPSTAENPYQKEGSSKQTLCDVQSETSPITEGKCSSADETITLIPCNEEKKSLDTERAQISQSDLKSDVKKSSENGQSPVRVVESPMEQDGPCMQKDIPVSESFITSAESESTSTDNSVNTGPTSLETTSLTQATTSTTERENSSANLENLTTAEPMEMEATVDSKLPHAAIQETSTSETSSGKDLQSSKELTESTLPLFQSPQSSLVSIDFIRSSILKKIEDKKSVFEKNSLNSNTNNVSKFESCGSQAEQKQSVGDSTKQITNTKSELPVTQNQEQAVNTVSNFQTPEDVKQNIRRVLHTETESITEFFDEESQLDLNAAVSLRARDGIGVRLQSLERCNESIEKDDGAMSTSAEEVDTGCLDVLETGIDVSSGFLENEVEEPEEGELHSSSSDEEEEEEDVRLKRRPRSKSGSKEKEGREEDKPRRSRDSESERTPRRYHERRPDLKEERRDSRSFERAPMSSRRSSRERRNEDRGFYSKTSVTPKQSRDSGDSDRYPRKRLGSSEVKSDRLRDHASEKADRRVRSRHDSSHNKSDRYVPYRNNSSSSETVSRDSGRSSRESYKPSRRK